MQSSRNASLDLVRGLSALLVCAFHLRQALFVSWPESHGSAPWKFLFYLTTGLGHQMVMLFFVLSGYFVGGSILKQAASFRLTDYAIARLCRLYVVLLPALAFTFLVDLATNIIAPEALRGAFQSVWHSGPPPGSFSHSLPTLLGNISFLQDVLVPVFGSNGPLWSLMCEFWYYALFPAALLAVGVLPASLPVRIASLALVVAAAFAFDHRFWTGAAVWSFGVLLHLLERRFPSRAGGKAAVWTFLASIMLFLGVSLANRVPSIDQLLGRNYDLITGLAAFVVLHQALRLRLPQSLSAISIRISDFSFSLYLFHFPVVVLFGSILISLPGHPRLQPNLGGTAIFLVALGGLLLVGLGAWHLFERRTEQVRKRVKQMVSKA